MREQKADMTLQNWDVCIIGSGAAGGIAALVLTAAGCRVLMLEAGPELDIEAEFKQHVWPYNLAHRGLGVGGRRNEFGPPGCLPEIEGEPYTLASGSRFYWERARIVGGRTNHWGQLAIRYADQDFIQNEQETGVPTWPLRYRDLDEYYSKVESYIGVHGTREGLACIPDGIFLPPPKPRCTELILKNGCDKLEIPCIPARRAVLTRPWRGRPACHYCGQCGRGCKTSANFNSALVSIADAKQTGCLTLKTNAMVRELSIGPNGKLNAVSYIDKITGHECCVRAKAVMLAASACESARLLLNSKSRLFPNGLANSSGVVGRYLRDAIGFGAEAYLPQLEDIPPHNHDGAGGPHLYVPWTHTDSHSRFLGGYHIEFGRNLNMPLPGRFDNVARRTEGYGRALKESCRLYYRNTTILVCGGQMVPNNNSFCEIDPAITDEWGIPVLRFHFQWGTNEFEMAKHMQRRLQAIIEASGGTYLGPSAGDRPQGLSIGGESSQELGTVRMGDNPKTSALNSFCQAHDVKNLFVIDGGAFPSSSSNPPTLTIMALAWRASEYLLQEAQHGEL